MIDPARALSLCHPIATSFITLLLASPALPLRHRRRRSPRRLLPPPCCAFFCSVAKQIANSFTEFFGFFIPIFVAVVVGYCGQSSCSLQQRLNSKKSLLHYSRRCVVIVRGVETARDEVRICGFQKNFCCWERCTRRRRRRRRSEAATTNNNSKQQQSALAMAEIPVTSKGPYTGPYNGPPYDGRVRHRPKHNFLNFILRTLTALGTAAAIVAMLLSNEHTTYRGVRLSAKWRSFQAFK